MMWHRRAAALWVVLLLLLAGALARAQIVATDKMSDVRATKHNFSSVADGTTIARSGSKVPVRVVKSAVVGGVDQVCVFCHTPHEATSGAVAPLWNRTMSAQLTYVKYTSSSMDASVNQPGGASKLCLSCHDGTMGIDKVNVLNGVKGVTVPMVSGVTTMPGANTTGFTRNLGTNLSNDHPISFSYTAGLAATDGELRGPDTVVKDRLAKGGNAGVGKLAPANMPLDGGQVQCTTCHDPHLNDKATSNGKAKFLRMNRFQLAQPSGAGFSPTNDIICLACHDKGASWAFSAHANSLVAKQPYTAAAAQKREFPSTLDGAGFANPPVWQVACLNCHDTHTVQGARRLLREGTSMLNAGTGVQDGLGTVTADTTSDFTKSAIENTCYQCHSLAADSIVTIGAAASMPPNIKDEFASIYRMPVATTDQGATGTGNSTEAHDIGTVAGGGADFVEAPVNLGFGALANRHAECTDCHNPHRVIKNPDGLVTPTINNTNLTATHDHATATTTAVHSNAISGVLRGTFGVEPIYGNGTSFQKMPTTFTVLRGDPSKGTTSVVKKEYQICLKCHSNYGYDDNESYDGTGKRPALGLQANGHTPSGTNQMTTTYTNQAREFQAPAGHAGEPGTAPSGSGASAIYDGAGSGSGAGGSNHRSWHPVMAPTGRTITIRNIKGTNNPWRAPWNNTSAVGFQTMYCTDCHGSNTAAATVVPTGPWGPHGSSNPFLLKGAWTYNTGRANSTDLCFKCHDPAIYRSTNQQNNASVATSGFSGSKGDNLHGVHGKKMNGVIKCNWCHVAVPHGWKNKAFLANLNDLGPEAGFATTGNAAPATGAYYKGPYYNGAVLRVIKFARSGSWEIGNCGNGVEDYMRKYGDPGNMCSALP